MNSTLVVGDLRGSLGYYQPTLDVTVLSADTEAIAIIINGA